MHLNRRELLATTPGALISATAAIAAPTTRVPSNLGIVIHSYAVRAGGEKAAFTAPLAFLEHAHTLGAAGIQVGFGMLDDAGAARLRDRAREFGMYVEGIVRLPRDASDQGRFHNEIRAAHTARAEIVRTVLLDGRRYEVFDTKAKFQAFLDEARRRLDLALETLIDGFGGGVQLAIENHKDLRADQLVRLLEPLKLSKVGVCLDTGNSIALLEDPYEVVETLAPWTITTHFKDMGVEEYEDGFMLSEVPLGTGFLDLKRIVGLIRKARPETRLNLEMITRDPLKIPCLDQRYWATLDDVPGHQLARMLAMVRAHPESRPLPRISQLDVQDQLRIEASNVQKSLAYARECLKVEGD